MELIRMYPELSQKTIWSNMPDWAARLVWREITIEHEIGHALPVNGFYKSLAIKLIKQAQTEFAIARSRV